MVTTKEKTVSLQVAKLGSEAVCVDMESIQNDLQNSALYYASRGFSVFPCKESAKEPLTKHGFKDASTDEAIIRGWWKRWPRANVAIVMGSAAGVFAVDLDGEAGQEAWVNLEREHGSTPATIEATTGGGGRHLLFNYPAQHVGNTQSKIGAGIDTRGEGGYIIAAPSLHPSGEPYEWANGRGPGELEPADAPGWLLEALSPKPRPEAVARINHDGGVYAQPDESERAKRASAYLAAMPAAIEGAGGHSALYAAATAVVYGFDLPPSVGYQILAAEFNPRCSPPWNLGETKDEKDFRRKITQADTKPHDQPRGYLIGEAESPGDMTIVNQSVANIMGGPKLAAKVPAPRIIGLGELRDTYPKLNPPVIQGLLRTGETANIIAAPKTGKSWLAYDLALAVNTGGQWLDAFRCEPGNVLLIDNELHGSTLAHRIPKVAEARGIDSASLDYQLDVLSLRGRGVTLDKLSEYLDKIERGFYKIIILDAWYRFIPSGLNENSNSDIMGLYNILDRYAAGTDAAWVVIHHTSKGGQGEKSVTDVGAGAGAQSRAADTHIVLRPHEEDDHIVLEAAVRSFAPVDPIGLRWHFPTWNRAIDLDTDALKGRKTAGEERRDTADGKGMQEILEVLGAGPLTTRAIRGKTAMGRDRCQRLLDRLTVGEAVTYTETKVRGGTAREYQAVGKRSESGPTAGLVSQSSG